MTEESPRIDREGIHIERDLADRVAMEGELDSNVAGEYRFPSPTRRRLAGWVYLFCGVVSALAFDGGWLIGLGFLVLAVWQFASSWPLDIDEHEALTLAAAAVDFPVGHSSAAVRFQGWRSRPRWSVVLYSATEPPDRRGLVVVDAVNGEIVADPYTEAVSSA